MDQILNTPLQKSAKKTNGLYGIEGWLSFFVFMLFSIGAYFIYFALDEFFRLKFGISNMLYILMLAAAGSAPLYLLNQLYARRENILKLTRIYLILFPVIWAAWSIYHADFHFSMRAVPSILFSLLLNIGTFSLPWYIYFSKSKRVKNTFTFSGSPLPASIQCPACSNTINLDEDERRNKPIVCAACGNAVPKEAVLNE